MKISYNWLKQFIKTNWSPEETAALLTDLGLEVEGVENFTSIPGGLKGVIVGHVLEAEPHPNADRLKLTKVDLGNGTPVQIVCGAPNVAKGQKVPVATVGTTLFDAEGNPMQIKKGKIRGEESHGMICAEDELGLGDGHDGILVLDESLKPGTPASEIFEVENDFIFDIGLTPNRADAMSHWGVARDFRAGLLQRGVSSELITPSTSSFHIENRTLKIKVEVVDKKLAPRYCGITISNLKVKPSPVWLQNRLKSIGLSPINNVVDVTNYILHDLGQPLHAFDANKISGGKVLVQTPPEGTKFTTLDGVERELHEEDLMICDVEKPMCIAGVFGGLESGVTENTTSIFLESAYFDPVSIRKSAKRHGLNTDASFRFERGIDPNITEYALMCAAIMLEEIADGEVTSDLVNIYPNRIEDHQVFLNFENTTKIIGQEIPKETIKEILMSLDIKINNVTETGIGMTIPAYRNDVTREADVIEEVLRVYGYNNIEISSTKLNASIAKTKKIEDYQIQYKIGQQLIALGFHEMLNNSLSNKAYSNLSEKIKNEHSVEIINPLSQDLEVLRQSMLFGALESILFNSNRKATNIKLFEFGKTYHQYNNGREENNHLCLAVSGNKTEDSWITPSEKTTFFYLKGVVTSLLDRLGINGYTEGGLKNDLFSEGIVLQKGKNLVSVGVVSKKVRKHFDIDTDVFFADFNWDAILESISSENMLLAPIPKYPKVNRDFALLLDEHVSFEALKKAALNTEKKLLKEVSLFDVYTGKNLPKGKKSYALSFTLQDERKTLTDKQIDKIMSKLQQQFEREFGAELR